MNKLPVICLMGPTAVGKTDLACELNGVMASELPIDIISVDSAMVYKGLNIGTGKPSEDILEAIPHALVDIRYPYQVYSVADFCHDAVDLINKSHSVGRIPLLVGGTMMYFKSLQQGINELPQASSDLREKLGKRIAANGLINLYEELQQLDSNLASKIKSNDSQRIIRALEVYYLTGTPMSELQNNNKNNNESKYNFINIILNYNDRTKLHDRIKYRFYRMLEDGFIEEVESLYHQSLTGNLIHAQLPAIKSCGYRQIWNYLEGSYNKNEMIEKSIVSTRQLAKRQLTWLRAWNNAKWFDVQNINFKSNIINYLIAFDFFEHIV